ncbi:heavy-metal-associated domain-containing protein [Fodinibius halophilus]|uniref:Heavy-metal-associated domain-containing protein n=1 Tax=Fodinibius halophilus TaxID=1736908 RepID=A0A6M1SUA5_9BACT|nr:heavy-metal-associated domain-containing protein [Fodinibius halophilus]NGP87096.1 heavy-metal-associated domain-containing protein [Fodinibius halophilus]
MNNIISPKLKILVFRSNIDTSEKVMQVRNELTRLDHIYRVDVDLNNSENVLRLECHPSFSSEQLEQQVDKMGFHCSKLK